MLAILKELVPEQYQYTKESFLHYIKCMKDKTYKVKLPDLSPYEIQIVKTCKGLVIVNHQNYMTNVTDLSFPSIERMILELFPKVAFVSEGDGLGFINDLIF